MRRIHLAGRRVTRGAEGPDGYGVWSARETACGVPWRGPGTVEPETTTDPDAVTCERCLHSWWRPIDIARDEWPALRWVERRDGLGCYLVGYDGTDPRVRVDNRQIEIATRVRDPADPFGYWSQPDDVRALGGLRKALRAARREQAEVLNETEEVEP